ncbi:MAG: DUF4097 domain-containing protein [Terriglobia bacterium]
MKLRIRHLSLVAFAATLVMASSLLARGVEGSFDRTLKVTGPVDLDVTTGSGNIAIRTGDASTVRVHGLIRVSDRWGGSAGAEAKVRALEGNPPIQQTGNIVRIGRIDDPDLRRHVSISYELEVPVETKVHADTGSGDQVIAGVKGPVKVTTGSGNLRVSGIGDETHVETGSGDIELNSIKGAVYAETGSGNIRAAGVAGAIRAHTGSGDVRFEQTSDDPVKADTGSGNVELSGVRGSLRASTGSGNITAQGEPRGDWKLDTGSGNVTMRVPATASFSLYAHTGSGSVNTSLPITITGKVGGHELRGKVGTGGSLVEVGTGSGDIHIE